METSFPTIEFSVFIPAVIFCYILTPIKKKVAKLHVLEAPKTGHEGDVAQPSLPQKLHSSRTNLIERQRHHMKRAPAERTAFRFVFMKTARGLELEIIVLEQTTCLFSLYTHRIINK
jgi:hypothetical protein